MEGTVQSFLTTCEATEEAVARALLKEYPKKLLPSPPASDTAVTARGTAGPTGTATAPTAALEEGWCPEPETSPLGSVPVRQYEGGSPLGLQGRRSVSFDPAAPQLKEGEASASSDGGTTEEQKPMGRPTPPALQSRLSRASSSSDLLSPESRRSANPHLRTKGSKRLNSCAAFSPAIAHHELLRGEVAMGVSDEMLSDNPAAWGFQAALLFVDISGFTNLCTKLDIDRLQVDGYTLWHASDSAGRERGMVGWGARLALWGQEGGVVGCIFAHKDTHTHTHAHARIRTRTHALHTHRRTSTTTSRD